MKSNTLIEKQLQRKKNPELVHTLILAKKNKSWAKVAGILSRPKRKRVNLNLSEINKEIGESKKVVIPGKVLSQGDVDSLKGTSKKIKIVAMGFSEKAKEKLLKSGCELSYIGEEIKSNPSAEGIKVLNTESKDSTLSKTKKGVFNK